MCLQMRSRVIMSFRQIFGGELRRSSRSLSLGIVKLEAQEHGLRSISVTGRQAPKVI